jgi:hypothetical protein
MEASADPTMYEDIPYLLLPTTYSFQRAEETMRPGKLLSLE